MSTRGDQWKRRDLPNLIQLCIWEYFASEYKHASNRVLFLLCTLIRLDLLFSLKAENILQQG